MEEEEGGRGGRGGHSPRRSDTERKSSAPLRPSCSSSFQVRRLLFSGGNVPEGPIAEFQSEKKKKLATWENVRLQFPQEMWRQCQDLRGINGKRGVATEQ